MLVMGWLFRVRHLAYAPLRVSLIGGSCLRPWLWQYYGDPVYAPGCNGKLGGPVYDPGCDGMVSSPVYDPGCDGMVGGSCLRPWLWLYCGGFLSTPMAVVVRWVFLSTPLAVMVRWGVCWTASSYQNLVLPLLHLKASQNSRNFVHTYFWAQSDL